MSRQQHSTSSGNETGSKPEDETLSHTILFRSRFGVSDTADDVRSQDRHESQKRRNESIGT